MAAPLNWLREKLAEFERDIKSLESAASVLRALIKQELKEPDGDLMKIPAREAQATETPSVKTKQARNPGSGRRKGSGPYKRSGPGPRLSYSVDGPTCTLIRDTMTELGTEGGTAATVAEYAGVPRGTASACLTALKSQGMVRHDSPHWFALES